MPKTEQQQKLHKHSSPVVKQFEGDVISKQDLIGKEFIIEDFNLIETKYGQKLMAQINLGDGEERIVFFPERMFDELETDRELLPFLAELGKRKSKEGRDYYYFV